MRKYNNNFVNNSFSSRCKKPSDESLRCLKEGLKSLKFVESVDLNLFW